MIVKAKTLGVKEEDIEKMKVPSTKDKQILLQVRAHCQKLTHVFLTQFETKLDEFITKVRGSASDAEGVFVKLSSRSPKDAVLESEVIKNITKEQLESRAYKKKLGKIGYG